MGILVPLLALAPAVYAQNMGTNYINNEAFNQAKNTSLGLVNQAKNTSLGLVNQAPDELKSAFNQAKNTSLGLANQAKNLIKNDTNSSKLMNLLEGDVGNLLNEFSNLFRK